MDFHMSMHVPERWQFVVVMSIGHLRNQHNCSASLKQQPLSILEHVAVSLVLHKRNDIRGHTAWTSHRSE